MPVPRLLSKGYGLKLFGAFTMLVSAPNFCPGAHMHCNRSGGCGTGTRAGGGMSSMRHGERAFSLEYRSLNV